MFKVKQLLPQKLCIDCKGCCRFSEKNSPWQPRLLEEEISIISAVCPAQAPALQGGRIQPSPLKDYYACPFLDAGTNCCQIYAARPLECRLYPFLIHKTREGIYLAADLNCPFIKEKRDTLKFRDYVNYLAGFLQLPEVASVIKRSSLHLADYSQTDNKLENLAILVL